DIVLEKKDSVLSIKEALLQFDKKTEKPYVEIKIGDQKFERRDVDLGISDGVNVEILSGVTIKDEIKIWNKTSKKEEEEKENN
ncbi:MAG: efflux transporter periplasmic adaptor subunit, partial [Lutibacter sp.]|nr:efflux transporter periplasmic adaptor subunit [Lutibacter sp.]